MKMLKDSECEGRADEPDGEHQHQGATRPRALGGVTGLHSDMSEEFVIDLLAGSLLLLSFRYNKQVFISILDTLNISTMLMVTAFTRQIDGSVYWQSKNGLDFIYISE